MTRSDLISKLAERFPSLAAKEFELAVKAVLESVTISMSQGKRVEIRGFGSFDLNHRPARVGRNPKTGKRVDVPEKYVPHFKAGKELRDRVDYPNQAQ